MMNWLRRNRRSPWYPTAATLVISLAVFAGVTFLVLKGWLQPLELRIYDVMLTRQVPPPPQPPAKAPQSRVAVIGVSEEDLQSGRVQVPISDEQMTRLLRILLPKDRSRGAWAVGIDIFRDLPAPDHDNKADWREQRSDLLELLKDARVFTVLEISEDGTEIAVPAPDGTKGGFADFPNDPDDVVRRALLYTQLKRKPDGTLRDDTTYRSLALRVAGRFMRTATSTTQPTVERMPHREKDGLRLGSALLIPFERSDGAYVKIDDGGAQMLLDYQAYGHINVYDAGAVLGGDVPPETFDGRAVFVGVTAQSLKDIIQTPVDTKVFGVMNHAVITDQLIRMAHGEAAARRVWPNGLEHAWAGAWTLVGGVIGLAIRTPRKFYLVLSTAAALACALLYVLFIKGTWVPVLPTLIGCVTAAAAVTKYIAHHERSERTVLSDLFNRIVDEDVAKTIWARRDELLDQGQLAARELRATVLFTDLEGFTTITEAMDKACLMRFLNDYMTAMSDVVGRRPGAFVNKYIGDAIMAVFGPPLDRTIEQARADARNAVECALEMRQRLAEHRERWERECSDGIRKKLETGEPPGAVPPWAAAARPPQVSVRMRIGIQSGMVTAGSLGSRQRLEYTVIGDTVNTAARLESFDKDLMAPDLAAGGCRILIGQDTLDLLPPGEYLTREVGSIQLKGKEQSVTIHGVIGRAESSSPSPTQSAAQEVQV